MSESKIVPKLKNITNEIEYFSLKVRNNPEALELFIVTTSKTI